MSSSAGAVLSLVGSVAGFARTPFGALALGLAALLICLVWLGLYPLRRWRYRHFPGPLGLPFLGNLPQIAAMDATHYLAHVGRKYGPVCKVWFGTRPWLVISDPDLVRKLASQSAMRAVDLPSYLDVLTGENRDIELASAFFAHGEAWRRGRRAFEMSIIHPTSLAGHLPAILHVLGRFVPSLERYASSGQPLDAQRAVGDNMLAITGELAYGVDFEVDFDSEHALHGESRAAREAVGGLGAHLARVSRGVFETFRMENASAYLPLQMVFPSLAPAIRWLAAVLPDANQRRIMAVRTAIADVSRQLMAQWAEAKQREHAGAAQAVKVEATCCQAHAATDGAAAAAANGAGIHAFREVGSGISASSFMAAMLEERKGAGAHDRLSDIEASQALPWRSPCCPDVIPGSLHTDRVFISSASLRKKLRRFYSRADQNDKACGLSEEEYASVLSVTATAGGPARSLQPYLEDFVKTAVRGDMRFFHKQPDPTYHFLRALFSESPVCSVVPRTTFHCLRRLIRGHQLAPSDLVTLSERAPLLHKFVLCEYGATGLSPAARSLLGAALAASQKAFQPTTLARFNKLTGSRRSQQLQDTEMDEVTEFASKEDEFLRSGYYYPSLPIQRHVRRYAADARSQRTGPTCNKYKNVVRGLTPGLFVVHCLNCATCVGFHMMPSHESPQTFFEWLYTRFLRAPSVVVYDNNCHGHAYCLNREPSWAADTTFVIDKTHYKGHKGCSRGYDISIYPRLAVLNSQLAEQKNSKLALLKSHCAFMSQPVFLLYIRLFLYLTAIMRC